MTAFGDTQLTAVQHLAIKQATARLGQEFAGIFGSETIERFITESFSQLEQRAEVDTWLPVLTERFARDRLRALAHVEGRQTLGKPAVLFVCVQNAGRSQMAAGWLRHLAGDRVEVYSGGQDPAAGIHDVAVQAMAEVGVDIRSEFPKPWTDEIIRVADVVVTMGCGDACPIIPGRRYEDWELTDPHDQPIEVVREVRDEIEQRIRGLMTSLEVTPVR
jgi:protein-tyrosine-phosphatase